MPVTTTRLWLTAGSPRVVSLPSFAGGGTKNALGRALLPQVRDGVPDRAHLLRILVGDVHAELLLESHHELDGIEGVRAQILHERRAVGHLLRLDAELVHDDLTDSGLG